MNHPWTSHIAGSLVPDVADLRTNLARERLVQILAAATFLIFFQAYMVAPLIPALARVFQVTDRTIGLAIPAYMIPYGISVLFYGLLSDWIGRRRIMLASLFAFAALTGLTALSQSASQLMFWRVLTGLGAGGVVPLALALIGSLYPYEQRGRPFGWLFGAMAGGMAFGSTFGVMAEPLLGWRSLFLSVSLAAFAVLLILKPYAGLLGGAPPTRTVTLRAVLTGYRSVLLSQRGGRTYSYVFLNAIFHSAVFTWLGLYFVQRHGLSEVGIGLALLGYGIPGFLFGPAIGRAADRCGRRWLIPAGLSVAALSAVALVPRQEVWVAALAVTALSLGYDMTQPLFAGIVSSLDPARSGQAMGLNVFALFTGFGVGSLLFGEALRGGFDLALGAFGAIQLVFAVIAIPLFRSEVSKRSAP